MQFATWRHTAYSSGGNDLRWQMPPPSFCKPSRACASYADVGSEKDLWFFSRNPHAVSRRVTPLVIGSD